jgi:hypothetical protein
MRNTQAFISPLGLFNSPPRLAHGSSLASLIAHCAVTMQLPADQATASAVLHKIVRVAYFTADACSPYPAVAEEALPVHVAGR